MGKIIQNNLVVDIDKVKPNNYNPKPDFKESEELKIEFNRIKNSLYHHGQLDPIQVRELKDGKYEIVNGYHRWLAMKELGMKKVEIKNLGKISRKEAIKIALSLEETKIPLDVLEVAELVKNLKKIGEGLPYSMEEIQNKISLLEFDFDKFKEEAIIPEDIDMVTLTLKVTPEQKEIILRGIEYLKEKEGVSEGRALELIVADFLAGIKPEG